MDRGNVAHWLAAVFALGCIGVPATSAAQSAEEKSPSADAEARWRVDTGLTFERFEQQAKVEVGGESGERLVEHSALSSWLGASYRPLPWLGLGLFAHGDVGRRRAARLTGFDTDGRAETGGAVGGRFRELWLGPLLRLRWRQLFAEAGWGALGLRWDTARDDLPASDGGLGTLRTSPRIAWLFGLGGLVPLRGAFELVLRVQYRIRYYTTRGGDPLANGIVHGTQNLSPLVGVVWSK